MGASYRGNGEESNSAPKVEAFEVFDKEGKGWIPLSNFLQMSQLAESRIDFFDEEARIVKVVSLNSSSSPKVNYFFADEWRRIDLST